MTVASSSGEQDRTAVSGDRRRWPRGRSRDFLSPVFATLLSRPEFSEEIHFIVQSRDKQMLLRTVASKAASHQPWVLNRLTVGRDIFKLSILSIL